MSETELAIANLGGRFGPPLELSALQLRIEWCEVGVVAVGSDGQARWAWEAGLIDDLRSVGDQLVAVESGGAVFHLDAMTGSLVEAA